MAEFNREVRDSMFKYMYSFEEYRRDLVVGLLGESFSNQEIIPVTLEKVFAPDVQNDLGLQVGNVVILLVEAQSTSPTNIALRMLEYTSRTLMSYIAGDKSMNLYGERKISLPCVRLYTVYTGGKSVDRQYFLRDHFVAPSDIDAVVHVLTRDSKNLPSSLFEYIQFSRKVNQLVNAGVKGEEFIDSLLDYCLSENILADLIQLHLEEVKDKMSYEEMRALQREKDRYDWQLEGREQGIVEGRKQGLTEGREQGMAEGRAQGLTEGREQNMLENIRALMDTLQVSEAEARKLLKLPLKGFNGITLGKMQLD